MNTLLKDLPEHKERIENSYLFRQDIKDALKNSAECLFDKSERGNVIELTETNAVSEENFGTVTEDIIQCLIEFVNDNYEFKGNTNLKQVVIKERA